MDAFTQQYLNSALGCSTDNSTPSGGYPLDKNYGIEDIGPDTLAVMVADCQKFQGDNADLPYVNTKQAGHDFWLTRNGHGAGFWDGDWPEPDATQLTTASKGFGPFTLYIGDDNKVHGIKG